MKLSRETWVLGIIAAVLVGLSVYFTLEAQKLSPKQVETGPVLGGLAETISGVETITISGQEETTTLTFDGTIWRVAERSGYPANASFVQGLLNGMKQSEKLDPKTNKEKYLDRLGLGEMAETITLKGKADQPIVSLKVGDQFLAPGGGGIITFAWDEQDRRAWTISSLPQITANPAFWLRRKVLRLSTYRIKSVAIGITGGASWSLSRTDPADPLFSLGNTGPGGVKQTIAKKVAYALAEVDLLDLAEREGMEIFQVATATYSTFDGLSIRLTFFEREGEIWTTLEAAYDEGILLAEDTPAVMPDAPLDGQAEADGLNVLWRGRAYLIPVTKIAEILQSEESLHN